MLSIHASAYCIRTHSLKNIHQWSLKLVAESDVKRILSEWLQMHGDHKGNLGGIKGHCLDHGKDTCCSMVPYHRRWHSPAPEADLYQKCNHINDEEISDNCNQTTACIFHRYGSGKYPRNYYRLSIAADESTLSLAGTLKRALSAGNLCVSLVRYQSPVL